MLQNPYYIFFIASFYMFYDWFYQQIITGTTIFIPSHQSYFYCGIGNGAFGLNNYPIYILHLFNFIGIRKEATVHIRHISRLTIHVFVMSIAYGMLQILIGQNH